MKLMKWFLILIILCSVQVNASYKGFYRGAPLPGYTLNKLLGRWYIFSGQPYGLGFNVTRTSRGTARLKFDKAVGLGGQTLLYNDAFVCQGNAEGFEDKVVLTGVKEEFVKSGMHEIFTEEHGWNHYVVWGPHGMEANVVWTRYPPREEDSSGKKAWKRLLALDTKKKSKKKAAKKKSTKKKSTAKITAKKPRRVKTRFTGVTGQIETWLVNAWNHSDVWLANAWHSFWYHFINLFFLCLLLFLIAVALYLLWRVILFVVFVLTITVDAIDFLFELVAYGCRRLPIALCRARRCLSRSRKRARKYLQASWSSSKRRLRRVWEWLSGAWTRVWHPERFAKLGELELLRFDNRQLKQTLSTPSGEISQRNVSQVSEEQAYELKKARDLVKRLECDVVGHQVLLEAQTEKAERLESELASVKTKLQKLESEPNTQECSICAEGTKSHAFLPCGHRCVCEACARLGPTTWSKCPICQQTVDGCVRIYL